MEHSSDRPEKINFERSNPVLEGDIGNGPFYLYTIEFFKSGLIVAEMQAVFNHIISRVELVRFLQGYDEVRNERYDARVTDIISITMEQLIQIRRKLVMERGQYKMTKTAIEAQDQDKIMEGAIENLLAVDPKTQAKAHKAPELKKLLKKKGML
jgi:hypothetical protein